MRAVSIYLAGNIQKDHENKSTVFWSEEDRKDISKVLSPRHVSFLNPAVRIDDLTDQPAVFGRDMTQVYCADIVFVDARERRGLGVGAEMMWAKINDIPVVTLAPRNSHYYKDKVVLLGNEVPDWTHPFVECLSDCLAESVEEGALWIEKYLSGSAKPIKGIGSIKEAMAHYKNARLKDDTPMMDLAAKNEALREKIEGITQLV